MRLNFYYNTRGEAKEPLVASAFIPGHGNESFPWPEGEIEFYDLDLGRLPGDPAGWKRDDDLFRSSLRNQLKQYIVVRNRDPLKPWTRLAFENIHQYGITRYYPFLRARLFEDDGTEFDPANAIPLYDSNYRGPVREPFRPPGLTPEQIEADEALFEEVSEMVKQRKRAREQNDSTELARIEAKFQERAEALEACDEAKLAQIREWFQCRKESLREQDVT